MYSSSPKRATLASLSVAFLFLLGCPGRIDDPESLIGPLDCTEYAPIYLQLNCAGAGCHSTKDAEGSLDLEAEGLEARLIGKPGAGTRCDAQDGLLVDPDAPEESLLITKMQPNPPCGDRMPLFDRPGTQADIDCIMEWLVAVTSPDPPDPEE